LRHRNIHRIYWSEPVTDTFLAGRTALITGSTSGIGLAIAEALGRHGAKVGINGLGTPEQIDAAIQQCRDAGAPDVRYFDANLIDPKAIDAMLAEAAQWSPIDVLVNSAGIQRTAPIEGQRDNWDAVIAINLSAAFHCMSGLLPDMRERGFGRVINIASVHGLVASVEKAPYVASKFGIVGLSKVAALEYASAGNRDSGGVTVNCICPGWVETPLIESQIQARADQHGGDRDAGIADLLSEKQPSRRMTLPEEIAELALWLCRREAHNLNGAAIPVDGGWTSQ